MSRQLPRARRFVTLGAFFCALGSAFCSPLAAAGEPKTAPASARTDRARRAYLRGIELRDEKKFSDAAAEFRKSLALQETTSTLESLAECLQQLGRSAGAWHASRRLLRVEEDKLRLLEARPGQADEGLLARERRRVKRTQQLIGGLEHALPASQLILEWAEPADTELAEVRLDGVIVTAVPPDGRLAVDSGKHELTVARKHAPAWQTSVMVEPHSRRVMVRIPAAESPPAPDDVRPARWREPAVWIPAATTAALAGAWLWASLEHRSRLDAFREVNASGEDPARARRLREQTEAMRAPVLIFGAATGIGLVTTVTLYLLDPDGEDASGAPAARASVTPWLSADGFGLSLAAAL